MDIFEIRRRNLRRLVNEHDGMNALGRKLGLAKGAYISQVLTDPPTRTLSEKTARQWEKSLGLPSGWIDGQQTPNGAQGAAALNSALLTDALADVLEVTKQAKLGLEPKELAELVVMQYNDAVALGRSDPERLRTILRLVKR